MITIISALLFSSSIAGTPADTIFYDSFDDTCIANAGLTRMFTSDMGYTGDGNFGTVPDVDTTEYASIWGHQSSNDTEVAWPGRAASSPLIVNFGRHQFIAAHFRVPSGLPSTLYGYIGRTDYNYGADLTASISTRCGDFSPAAVGCLATTPGGNFPRWTLSATGNQCKLTANTDYYLNVKFTNPSQTTTDCPARNEYCTTGTTNNIGGN